MTPNEAQRIATSPLTRSTMLHVLNWTAAAVQAGDWDEVAALTEAWQSAAKAEASALTGGAA